MQHWTDNIGLRKPIVEKNIHYEDLTSVTQSHFFLSDRSLAKRACGLAGRIANVYQTEFKCVQRFLLALLAAL
jgi:hypothetical protein